MRLELESIRPGCMITPAIKHTLPLDARWMFQLAKLTGAYAPVSRRSSSLALKFLLLRPHPSFSTFLMYLTVHLIIGRVRTVPVFGV
jgi:hypothetical protein